MLRRLLGRHAEAEAPGELDAPDPGRAEGAGAGVARLLRRPGPGKLRDEGAHPGSVEREVERDPAAVVAQELRGQLADARGLLRRADADVVHVDLVLDRDEVDRAEQVVELHERHVQVLDRLVEGIVVGRVQAGHAEEARQEVREALAELAHLVREGTVLAEARAPEGLGEGLLRPAQVVVEVRSSGLSHGTAPFPCLERGRGLRPQRGVAVRREQLEELVRLLSRDLAQAGEGHALHTAGRPGP